MAFGADVGRGRIVKIGDPSKEGFQTTVQGIYVGSQPGEYNNLLHDFVTPDGKITVPGSAALDNRLKDGRLMGRLVQVHYTGEGTNKKGKPVKLIEVHPWEGALPPEWAALVEQEAAKELAEVPAALKDKDGDDLPF